jgi:hypothetical protein
MSRRLSLMGSPRTVSARTASPSKRLLPTIGRQADGPSAPR